VSENDTTTLVKQKDNPNKNHLLLLAISLPGLLLHDQQPNLQKTALKLHEEESEAKV